jgi:rhodanese-related sulfurtransferase
MDRRARKNALFEAIALMGKAFASPRRLELLDLLAQAPRTVDELARASEQSTANTSQHLQALHTAGMVTRAREGTSVRYALAGDEALSLWLALRDASAARLAEVERAVRDYLGDDVEAVGRDELLARLRRGEIVLVDVRPREEFEAGHIRGARSIPLDDLDDRLAELPADREVVAYCGGPFCAYAHEAVRRIRAAGGTARRLEEGWPEWRLGVKPRRTRPITGRSQVSHPLDEDAAGYIAYNEDGYVFVAIMRPARTPFVAGDLLSGSYGEEGPRGRDLCVVDGASALGARVSRLAPASTRGRLQCAPNGGPFKLVQSNHPQPGWLIDRERLREQAFASPRARPSRPADPRSRDR